ncbi:MAG: hypothetical protein WCH62_07710, partial [Candidatus Omnitrophota bacterium]
MKKGILLVVFLMVVGAAFAKEVLLGKPVTSQISDLKTELATFNLVKPEEDMERNYAQGNKQFMSICTYSCDCPGVNTEDGDYVKQYGSRIVAYSGQLRPPSPVNLVHS